MRRLGAKALAWSALAMAAVGSASGTGCKATKATEVIPGVSSQMVVPKDLTAIRLDVEANGAIAFCQQYSVAPGGIVQLPSTLGVLPQAGPETVVTITIRGYDMPGVMGGDIANCAPAVSALPVDSPSMNGPGPRIIRRSIQKFVDQKILFLPMPLSYSCQDTDCSAMGQTFACKGGLCLDSNLVSTTLAEYDPTLLDGTGICFSPMDCLADGVPATLVDPDKCVYGFPSWDTPLAGTGANVRVFYKDITWQANSTGGFEPVLASAGEAEILNEDAEDAKEGFTLVNAADAGLPEAGPKFPGVDAGPVLNAKGQLIQLAEGLCNLVKAGTTPPSHPVKGAVVHTISDVQIASACPPKEPLLPICAAERTNSAVLPDGGTTADGLCNVAIAMDPAASAVYLVADKSVYMHGAYGASGSAQALSLSLSDPVFKKTFAGFKFLSDMGEGDCTATPTSYLTGGPDYLPVCAGGMNCTFDLAADLQPQIAAKLNGWSPSEGPGAVTCSGMGMGAVGCAINQFCYQGQCYTPNPLDLQGAMRPAGAYQLVQNFLTQAQIKAPNIAGVMFIVNRAPVAGAPPVTTEGADCATAPLDVTISASVMPGDSNSISPAALSAQTVIENEALDALATPNFPLHTYFVVLSNDDGSTEALDYFTQVASDIPQAVTTLDATALSGGIPNTMGAQSDVAAFLDSVTKLGTCLYDLPSEVASGTAPSTLEVSFSPPGAPPATCKTGLTCVPFVPGCTAASEASPAPPDGWSYDGTTRIRICGMPCAALRQYTILAAQTEVDVPVTITNLCSGTTGGGSSGGVSSSGGAGGTIDSGGAAKAIPDAAAADGAP